MTFASLADEIMRCVRPRGRIVLAGAALVLAACSDPSGPEPSFAKRSSRLTESAATSPSPSIEPQPLRFVSWAPPLETYDTTFNVVQGQASSDTIYFRATQFSPRMPYMVLATPADAQYVDRQGRPARPGEKIRLTVLADSQYVRFDFGPHGSTFSGNPAVLRISWIFTDLFSRPAGDQKLYYQLDDGSWLVQSATVDLQYYWLVTQLRHFSNYRVAF